MPQSKLGLILDTHRRTLRFGQYDLETVLLPLEHAPRLVGAFQKLRAAIDADRKLTSEGKADARAKARSTTLDALKAWHESRLKGLDADLLQQRAALMTQTERPDQRRVDVMASELVKFTPHDADVIMTTFQFVDCRGSEPSASIGNVRALSDHAPYEAQLSPIAPQLAGLTAKVQGAARGGTGGCTWPPPLRAVP